MARATGAAWFRALLREFLGNTYRMNGYTLASIGNWVLSICVVACWLTLIVQTFIRGETGMGLLCLLLCACGVVVGLAYGWTKASEWNNLTLMLAYSISCAMLLLSFLVSLATAAWELSG